MHPGFEVFLEAPCQLFTSDIQSAFMHLSTGRKEVEIAYLNRAHQNIFIDAVLNDEYYARPDHDKRSSSSSQLEPFLIKDLSLRLVIPKYVRREMELTR